MRRATVYFARDTLPKWCTRWSSTSLPTGIPVAVTCRVLGFSKQAFYSWCRNPVSQRDWDDAHLINAALDIHQDDPEFGYRFIADELTAAGIVAGRNRVNRLCTLQRIFSVHSRKRGLSRKPGPPVHDLVEPQFVAEQPDQLWLTDISEHPTDERKPYLCAVKDACSTRIVGYSIGSRMTSELAVAALRNAVALRSPAATVVVHSDRGSQFRSPADGRTLRDRSRGGARPPAGAARENKREPLPPDFLGTRGRASC